MAKTPPLTDPRFESAPLDTSRPQLRRQYPYEHYVLTELGTLNLDANDSTLQKGELTDALNLRMTKPGEYEIRTGYADYPKDYGGNAVTLLCKSEFRYKNFILDIAVVWYNNQVRIQAVNNVTLSGSAMWSAMNAELLPPPVCDANSLPICAAAQYQNYIIVTVYDIGTFACYPVGPLDSATQFDTWTVISLGKSLCPTPWKVDYVDEHIDDLINFQYDVESRALAASITTYPLLKNNPQSSGNSSLTPPFLYDRLKIKTPYTRTSKSGQPFDVFGTKLWQWNPHDAGASNVTAISRLHLQTRAWGYRFVFIRSVSDGRGGKIVFRSQASTDMWVPNNIYSPPQPLQQDPANINQVNRRPFTMECDNPNTWTIMDSRGSGSANKYPDVSVLSPFTTSVITVPPPAPLTTLLDEPMVTFAKAIADYEGISNIAGVVNSPVYYPKTPFLYFTMWYAGFRICGADNTTISFSKYNNSSGTYATPYWTEVPASFLAQAPLTIFKWTDFSLLADGLTNNSDFPSDVTEIEVYRTAFSDGDAKTTDGDPLFQPDLYGYVGSIKSGKDFTDDIKDTAIDFAKSPERYDGYLAGQFSGQAIRRYNRKLVIGNTSTSYWVEEPAPFVMQAYAIPDGLGAYSGGDNVATTDVTTNSYIVGDIDPSDNERNKIVQFFYSYVDAEGNESDLAKVYVESPVHHLVPLTRVAFLVGQGYSPYVTAVRLYKSYLTSAQRSYKLIAEIDVNSGYYYSDNTEFGLAFYDGTGALITAGSSSIARPEKHTVDGKIGGKVTRTPGGITWSGVYAPFDWDPLHFEVISTEAPITYLDSLIGEFWIFTDRGVHLSNIDNTNPKGEEESEEIGAIGRFAAVKVDKIIFFLSAGGMYFAESSGVHPFPGSVQTEILKYINEEIPGQPDLANVRRASMGYSKKRQELWVYLPSSVDLGGTLLAKLFIYKFFSDDIDAASIRRHVNYQFELIDPADADKAVASMPLIFQGHSDGRLFCSYGGFSHEIHTLDNDTGSWTGRTALEFVMGLIDLNLIKMLRKMEITGDFDCDLEIYTGIANPSHTHDSSGAFPRGLVNAQAVRYKANEAMMGTNVKLPHTIAGSLWNTTANAPVVRLVTAKDSDGDNIVRYKAIDIWYQFIHDHP